jgi:type IV pilus biogenesis protein CpaD/CtpE
MENQEKYTTASSNTTTITLPSGRVAEVTKLKGKHIREAIRLAGGDETLLTFAMVALGTRIDGAPITIEELDEMDSAEVLPLLGAMGNVSSAQKT